MLQRQMEMDIAFKEQIIEWERRLPSFISSRVLGGSGLPISNLLRHFFQEYANRVTEHGYEQFPSSFQVIESFLTLGNSMRLYDLREEREFLLSSDDYFDWYSANPCPLPLAPLTDIMRESVIYSFNFVGQLPRVVSDTGSAQFLLGMGMIRHSDQLSCFLLAGESEGPANSIDSFFDDLANVRASQTDPPRIKPHPHLTREDRFIPGHAGLVRLIAMGRFSLQSGECESRYFYVDMGNRYSVITDDFSLLWDVSPDRRRSIESAMKQALLHRNHVFSALTTLLMLPAFFASNPARVFSNKVDSRLKLKENKRTARQIQAVLGIEECPLQRDVSYFSSTLACKARNDRRVQPPEIKHSSKGRWEAISPTEFGIGPDGEKVFGRTWVKSIDTWSIVAPEAFFLSSNLGSKNSPDPGTIYIMRCPEHNGSIYKVGITRRDTLTRAAELSASTGVPMGFCVIAQWYVGNCRELEKRIHQELKDFRIAGNREFFCLDLGHLTREVERCISQQMPSI